MLQQISIVVTAATAVAASKAIGISATAGLGLDVFGIAKDQSIYHKYYRGSQWEPVPGFESMNGTAGTYAPTAISTAPGTLDYFFVGADNAAYHKFWDGSGEWQPAGKDGQKLKGSFAGGLAAGTWGAGKIDLVGRGPDGEYHHLYFRGQDNVGSWEDFGGNFSSKPAAVSWGPNRLDVIGITVNGTLAHKFWDGSGWQPAIDQWEDFGGNLVGDPVITSMGSNRFDFWAAGADGGLYHKYWNGQFYSDWENLGGDFTTAPQVVHHTPGRIDIVGQFSDDSQYQYKLFDGSQWLPNAKGWFPKGGDFATQPAVVTTRPNEFNIFGVGNDGNLYLQFWTGWDWQPSTSTYYSLGDTKHPYPSFNNLDTAQNPQVPIVAPELHEDI